MAYSRGGPEEKQTISQDRDQGGGPIGSHLPRWDAPDHPRGPLQVDAKSVAGSAAGIEPGPEPSKSPEDKDSEE
jgi:hypothetical protein